MNIPKNLQNKLNKFKEVFSMSEITGIVKTIQKKTDVKGRVYYVVTMEDGTKLGSSGDNAFAKIADIKTSQEATIFYEVDNNYKNITGSIPVVQQEGVPSHTPPTEGYPVAPRADDKVKIKTYVTDADKQSLIIRQSSLKSAVEWLKDCEGTRVTEDMIKVAKRFEEFVNTGE
jgi:hypothetical protein